MTRHIVKDPVDIESITGPKHVRYGIGEIEVLTGEDIPAPIPTSTLIPADVLARRFTDAEIMTALTKRKTEADIDFFLFKLCAYDPIDLAAPEAVAAFNAMVAKGVLTAARKTQIMAI